MWQFASLGLNLAQSLLSHSAQQAQYDAQRTLDKAQVKASNLLREGENEKAAARTSLNGFLRSLNNQRVLRAGGEQDAALATNYLRTVDASTRGNLQQQLAAAEALGQLSANAAWRGVGGASTELVERTMRLRSSQMQAEQDIRTRQASSDFATRRAQARTAMAESADYRYELAGLDYRKDQTPYRAAPSLAGTLLGFAANNMSDINNAFASLTPPRQATPTPTDWTVAQFSAPTTGATKFFDVGGPGGIGVQWQI